MPQLRESVSSMVQSMEERGGGIGEISLVDKTAEEPGLFQIFTNFDTCDAMGANFINSVLEAFAVKLKEEVSESSLFSEE